MGRRGPKTQSAETRQKISEGLRGSDAFKKAVRNRLNAPRRTDGIEARARKSAAKYAPSGTRRNQFEYELALQRIAMLDNQVKRRELFEQSETEGL